MLLATQTKLILGVAAIKTHDTNGLVFLERYSNVITEFSKVYGPNIHITLDEPFNACRKIGLNAKDSVRAIIDWINLWNCTMKKYNISTPITLIEPWPILDVKSLNRLHGELKKRFGDQISFQLDIDVRLMLKRGISFTSDNLATLLKRNLANPVDLILWPSGSGHLVNSDDQFFTHTYDFACLLNNTILEHDISVGVCVQNWLTYENHDAVAFMKGSAKIFEMLDPIFKDDGIR